ncbi:hypothetical protein JQ633_12570 [Bradyrhizobium tropiciagri]|uniref:hypothetical protein n=1 Tax=Bradyrhizobium tropiciagri TaxID=312253 RepID=UPI001BA48891|nr:hypothetical protein [Bradyrhizobium tropiciagri]MBR0871197.1 hypothetical protein [Bradyrhizobium tropiciagri]
MAILLADSFDFYSSNSDMVVVGGSWATANTNLSSGTPYGVGRSMGSSSTSISSNAFSNESTIYLAFAVVLSDNITGTNSQGAFVTLGETAGSQVTLQWAYDGNFYVRAGGTTGTIIGTWPHGMVKNLWAHYQVKVVINDTTGSVELRKDGNPTNNYTLTGVNTRNGTANAYANKISIASSGGMGLDDLFVNSASGAAPTSWPGQLRSMQLMPTADTAQKDFVPSAVTSVVGTNSTANTQSLNANTIYFQPSAVTAVGGTASKITAKLNAGFTGKMKCALYTDTSGLPGTLVAQTSEVINPVTGDNDFAFTSPPALVDGNSYWIAFWTDTAAVLNTASGGTTKAQALNYATASGNFPSTVTTGSGVGGTSSVRLSIATANYSQVNDPQQNGDTDYVSGSAAGNVDLYDLADIPGTPTAIVAVITRALLKKSDAGSRTATTRLKSGGTFQDGATLTLTTSYQWQSQVLPVDPDTGSPWSVGAVNALQIGPKVVA